MVWRLDNLVLRTYHTPDYDHNKSLLTARKDVINSLLLPHQEILLPHIIAFNDALMEAMRRLYDQAHQTWEKIAHIRSDWKEPELNASLELSWDYPTLHPVQDNNRQELWTALGDACWNPLYADGVTPEHLHFPHDIDMPFDDYTGLSCPPPNWNEGLDQELTKELHLCSAFHHLFDHTNFALTDFIFVREFHPEIEIDLC